MLATAGLVCSFNCPENQYPYSCSTCLKFSDMGIEGDFDVSTKHCRDRGGDLISVEDDLKFKTLTRYLLGLNETRRLWIGYRYTSSGSQVGTDGKVAPSLLQSEGNFNGEMSGDENSCIGIHKGMFFTASCSESLGFICLYIYKGE